MIHAQRRPQETPPAKTDSKDNSRKRVHMVQCTGDTMAGRVVGCTSDLDGAPQPMHEDSQGSRGQAPNPHQGIQRCSWERKCRSSGVRPSDRTIRNGALVGSQGSRYARRPPTPPQSTSQIHPGRADHDPAGCTNERVRAYTGASNL
jgi:hypothetical protein